MNRSKVKNYAPQARLEFIQAVTGRAAFHGLTTKKIEPIAEQGDVAIIGGRPFPKAVAAKRKKLEERLKRDGFEQVMEALAYTWFNRFVAIRYMELHGYLEHGYRVLSNPNPAKTSPELLEHAEHVDLPGLTPETVIELKLAGNQEAALYRMLLVAQCNALHSAMPFLFERIDDGTELVLPENLLHSDSILRKLVSEIDEEDWQEVEIIGWLYQFYISDKKAEVIGKVVKSEDIPAATQLFTPDWIVKYLVQNSLGRMWIEHHPDSPLKAKMEYYIEPAEQTPEVHAQLQEIIKKRATDQHGQITEIKNSTSSPSVSRPCPSVANDLSLNPEFLTLLDPACGSGHILVEAYELFKAIYQERGYNRREIPRLILTRNLFGLEIDDRAAQLASLALMMKARADNRRIFETDVRPHVLSIQESQGLDAKEITDALNQPILKEKLPPSEELFEEIAEEKSPLFSRKNLAVKGEIAQADIAALIELFEHGKTFGSLIRVPEKLAGKLPAIAGRVEEVLVHGGMFEQTTARSLASLVKQARCLSRSYGSVVANPPYMGSGYFNGPLKGGLMQHYNVKRTDLYVIFVERCLLMCDQLAMVTRQDWMFTKSYASFRHSLLQARAIHSLCQLGPDAFEFLTGEVVQASAFCFFSRHVPRYTQTFFDLTAGDSNLKASTLRSRSTQYVMPADDFDRIPGSPIVYWISENERQAFAGPRLNTKATLREGIHTGRNADFLRYWWEINLRKFSAGEDSYKSIDSHGVKWIPYNKGASSRRWYGANEFVIAFDTASRDEMASLSGHVRPSQSLYFLEGGTWSDVGTSGFGVRYYPAGFLFDGAGPIVISSILYYVIGLMNSKPFRHLAQTVMPNLHYKCGTVKELPFVECENKVALESSSKEAIAIARADWDSFERSWEFAVSPLVQQHARSLGLADSFSKWQQLQADRRTRMGHLEQEMNRAFIVAFGLQEEVTDEIAIDEIPVGCPNRQEDTKRLISYAIGCMMGRFSLNKPGLIYAHSGNVGFDPSQYQTFPADPDGLVSLMESDWFPDDAANRFIEFIGVAWPKEHLEENLKFVADSLGPNRNEQPRETIRRYLATGFYKHHLSMYKRRPIYWLFSSGKQRAFQCLVYLHRYNEGTLSRMRTEYVIPLQGKLAARIEQLATDIGAATATSHRKKLEKERDTLLKQQAELHTFDEKLRHYADQRIAVDLDDGVKVNYSKFGDLLAEVKAVTGRKVEG